MPYMWLAPFADHGFYQEEKESGIKIDPINVLYHFLLDDQNESLLK